MSLRDEIAAEIMDSVLEYKKGEDSWQAADRILAIPEIANGQALLDAKRDELFGGTGFVKITRVDPADVYLKPDDPSISTHSDTE